MISSSEMMNVSSKSQNALAVVSELRPELAVIINECRNVRCGEIMLSEIPTDQTGEKQEERSVHGRNETDVSVNGGICMERESLGRADNAGFSGMSSQQRIVGNTTSGHHSERSEDITLLRIPRTRVLKVTRTHGLEISNDELAHWESETRFVAAFKRFTQPHLERRNSSSGRAQLISANNLASSGCVFVSKDTDVTLILGLAKCLHGKGVIHVLGENVIDIDALVHSLTSRRMTVQKLASVYVLAGCDFTPGTYGVSHENYLCAALRHVDIIARLDTEASEESMATSMETTTLLAYLEKHGMRKVLKPSEKQGLEQVWLSTSCDLMEIRNRCRRMFVSEHDVGSTEWGRDVRRYISERAKSVSDLVPLSEHVRLQSNRTQLIVSKYWNNAEQAELSYGFVGGCMEEQGFDNSGRIIIEMEEDVKRISKKMQELVANCRCKGQCNNRRCSCVKREVRCVGCDCDELSCRNMAMEAIVNMSEDVSQAKEAEEGSGEEDKVSGDEEELEEREGNSNKMTEIETDLCGLEFMNTSQTNPDHDIDELFHFLDNVKQTNYILR